jgi:hypothetical protein
MDGLDVRWRLRSDLLHCPLPALMFAAVSEPRLGSPAG